MSKNNTVLVFTLASLAILLVPSRVLAIDATGAGSRPGLQRTFESRKGKAAIGSGILKSKTGTTLVVTSKDGVDYTVNTDSNTHFERRFWGKGTLDEMQVGDTLNVIGRWTDDTHTAINAVLVRDLSIMKRFGVFFGTVSSLTADGWVMKTQRGDETVTVDSTTKFVNRRGETITKAGVKVGDRVRVRGLWDKTNSTLTEVKEVKDFSLPVAPTATP